MPLLELRDVRGWYGEIEALHGVDFSVEQGEIVALLGANGAGKTTSLRAVCGMVKTTGEVVFDGSSLRNRAPEDIARTGVAYVPEGRGTLFALSVRENLALGAYTLPESRARERYRRVVEYFPWLDERKDQVAGTLSGGEQQMLAIARALMMGPRLMLLDEPSLGLAPMVVRDIFAILGKLNREEGVTIVLAEQNAAAALAAAARSYVLETGRVAASGASTTLASDAAVRKSYLGY